MTDHFAVLRQQRRPWLDAQQLKQKYHELARTGHPDRKTPAFEQSSGDEAAPNLAALNEAYSVLSNPRLRLRHLLELDGDASASKTNELTSDLADLFMEAAALIRDFDVVLAQRSRSTTALTRSLGQSEMATINSRADRLLETLSQLYHAANQDLQRVDRMWLSDRAKASVELCRLIQRFSYLDRWMAQLREKQFQLET
jgi:curved DNA-binding protein CbpA